MLAASWQRRAFGTEVKIANNSYLQIARGDLNRRKAKGKYFYLKVTDRTALRLYETPPELYPLRGGRPVNSVWVELFRVALFRKQNRSVSWQVPTPRAAPPTLQICNPRPRRVCLRSCPTAAPSILPLLNASFPNPGLKVRTSARDTKHSWSQCLPLAGARACRRWGSP